MKLELKHIVGYLPYGLKGISIEENLGFEIVKGFSIYGKNNTISLVTNVDDIDLVLFKPILHPLSDLTKHCDDLGFVPITELLRQSNFDVEEMTFKAQLEYVEPYSNILFMSHLDAQKLLEWHFDIYGLIENGLAIDVNTIK